MTENKLLIVDDEPEICALVGDVAGGLGFSFVSAVDYGQFEASFPKFRPTAITLDLMMPKLDGIELIRKLSAEKCQARILLMSGADSKVLGTARRLGTELGLNIVGTLHKPFEVAALRSALALLFAKSNTATEPEFLDALAKHELVAYFQPKVILNGSSHPHVEGAEALVRWKHPRLGVLTPDRFLPIAMRARMMNELTDAVMRSALVEVKRWPRRAPAMEVGINLAADSLDDLDLPDRLADQASANGVEPTSIVLEITESAAMAEGTRVMDVVTRLRLKGFGISLDDFGTGYSSLVRLYRLPFTELKIDKSFVAEAEESREAQAIIRSTIALSHSLDLKVCAEGVETEKQREILRSEKCDKAQGYLFGRPMPADQFAMFLEGAGTTKRSARGAPAA